MASDGGGTWKRGRTKSRGKREIEGGSKDIRVLSLYGGMDSGGKGRLWGDNPFSVIRMKTGKEKRT